MCGWSSLVVYSLLLQVFVVSNIFMLFPPSFICRNNLTSTSQLWRGARSASTCTPRRSSTRTRTPTTDRSRPSSPNSAPRRRSNRSDPAIRQRSSADARRGPLILTLRTPTTPTDWSRRRVHLRRTAAERSSRPRLVPSQHQLRPSSTRTSSGKSLHYA